MKCWPIIIMRATQKKMMSKPVTSTLVGYQVARSLVCSGQPMVEKGHRAEENQVSSTSSSCFRSVQPHLGQELGSCSATMSSPHCAQVQAGGAILVVATNHCVDTCGSTTVWQR